MPSGRTIAAASRKPAAPPPAARRSGSSEGTVSAHTPSTSARQASSGASGIDLLRRSLSVTTRGRITSAASSGATAISLRAPWRRTSPHMAARRLLIVMLILLGVSTLAAALVPQRTLRDSGTTPTRATTTTTAAVPPNPAIRRPTKILVGGKKFPVVAPVSVGDQLTLLVRSRFPAEIMIPEFGLVGFATPDTPARFELLLDTPGTIGILFGDSEKPGVTGRPAARIIVVQPGAKEQKRKGKKGARSPARGESGRA